ncbi:MAG: twin-arginine translocase TatA/TatE family subunit [Rhodobacteraceae bacterium]|nr:twin-arginine translocase TatA/TatE family subunit [Paracoccaceae bacterium]
MIGNIGWTGAVLIAIVVLVLFGRGKISSMMGEVGRGITSFRKGLAEGREEDDRTIGDAPASEAKDITPDKDKT